MVLSKFMIQRHKSLSLKYGSLHMQQVCLDLFAFLLSKREEGEEMEKVFEKASVWWGGGASVGVGGNWGRDEISWRPVSSACRRRVCAQLDSGGEQLDSLTKEVSSLTA